MVAIWFPGLYIPELALPPVKLAEFWLFGVKITIGWGKVVIIQKTTIWNGFKLFDTDDIVNAILTPISNIPKAVFDFIGGWLDKMADDFYAAHSTYDEYVRERDGTKDQET